MNKIWNWGVISAGKISHDFVNCLNQVKEANVVAVAARNPDSAKNFAKEHKIAKSYGSYQELVEDKDVQIVYVGSIHTYHKEHTLMALNAGKHVVCEKPITLSLKDTEELISVAKNKNLFLLEGVLTRFFPAIREARRIIRSGEIGDVKLVSADFCI